MSSSIELITNPEVLRVLKERRVAQHETSRAQASQSKVNFKSVCQVLAAVTDSSLLTARFLQVLEYLEEQRTLQLPTAGLVTFAEKAQAV